jgi:hypothetical protein
MTPADTVDQIRALAKLHGWAIGSHGSMARDIDLIAVPWTEDPSPLHVLLAAICTKLELVTLNGADPHDMTPRTPYRWSTLLKTKDAEVSKIEYPNRLDRMGIFHSRTFWTPPVIDLTFVDPREVIPPVVPSEPPAAEINKSEIVQ